MRIGVCDDHAYDCPPQCGPRPVGELVQLLRIFRLPSPSPGDGRLLARNKGTQTLIKQLSPVSVQSRSCRRHFQADGSAPLRRSQPRHSAPQRKAPAIPPRDGLDGIPDALLFAQHAVEMSGRSLSGGPRDAASIASPSAKPKSSPRLANSTKQDNGQRLAG